MSISVHPEEVRGVDHRGEHIAEFRHAYDILSGVGKVYVALPCHDSEYVERDQHAFRMQLLIGAIEEVGDHVRTLPIRMGRLEIKLRISLIAFRWKTNVIELNFISAGLRDPLS